MGCASDSDCRPPDYGITPATKMEILFERTGATHAYESLYLARRVVRERLEQQDTEYTSDMTETWSKFRDRIGYFA